MIRNILAGAANLERSGFHTVQALRCTLALAITLGVGVIHNEPGAAVFAAVGAVSVGFGAFQDSRRRRTAAMLSASIAMALSLLVGSLAGYSTPLSILIVGIWGFGNGLAVSVGSAASFVALQAGVAVVISTGIPSDFKTAAGRALLVLSGGLLQTFLFLATEPRERGASERRKLGAVYRSLAQYASALPKLEMTPPEPHTLANGFDLPTPLHSEAPEFQALVDEAEIIRTALAALLRQRHQLLGPGAAGKSCDLDHLTGSAALFLNEIATAIEQAHLVLQGEELWDRVCTCATSLGLERSPLMRHLRAAWQIMRTPQDASKLTAISREPKGLPSPWPFLRQTWNIVWENLTPQSVAFRHGVRLAASLIVATAVYRLFSLPRGPWVPLTALIVLKPEFRDTFTRGVARVAGTVAGAVLATLMTMWFAPGSIELAILAVLFTWLAFALFQANYAIFAVCLTSYVVALLAFARISPTMIIEYRVLNTVLGGSLALIAYAVFPTWEAARIPELLAKLLRLQGRAGCTILSAFGKRDPSTLEAVQKRTAEARVARANAEAAVQKMLDEPTKRYRVQPDRVRDLMAAVQRYSLAVLTLRAYLDTSSEPELYPEVKDFAAEVETTFTALAATVEGKAPAPDVEPLRSAYVHLEETLNHDRQIPALILSETGLMLQSALEMEESISKDGNANQKP